MNTTRHHKRPQYLDSQLVEPLIWAVLEFSGAQLGDSRRTARLIDIASRAAVRPASLITVLCENDKKDLRNTYNFLENEHVSPDSIFAAHAEATARRCLEHDFVFLPIDGSSFQFDDATGAKNLGRIGTEKSDARGLKTILGLAVSADGIPLGVLGQAVWTRPVEKTPKGKKKTNASRSLEEKESRYWHQVRDDSERIIEQLSPHTRLCTVVDREGDSWHMLARAMKDSEQFPSIIRARTNRNLDTNPEFQEDEKMYTKLYEAMDAADTAFTYSLDIPAGPNRAARTANMVGKWQEVTLLLNNTETGEKIPTRVTAVLAKEQGTTPPTEKPVEWLLLTTLTVQSVKDACQVLYGYSLRWRIELLHAAMKERGIDIEQSQLEDVDHLRRWLAVLLAVGVRLLRIVYLGRNHAHLPATTEFSEEEIDAMLYAHKQVGRKPSSVTIGEAMVMVAKLGGHVGDPAKRPIGFKVLARGMKELAQVLEAFEALFAQSDEDILALAQAFRQRPKGLRRRR